MADASERDGGYLGNNGIAEGAEAGFISLSSSSPCVSVQPGGKPIIHSTNRGCRVPPVSSVPARLPSIRWPRQTTSVNVTAL